jgi:hypothetical protein
MQKLAILLPIVLLLSSSTTVIADSDWSDSWEFEYAEEPEQNQTDPPDNPPYDPQATFTPYTTSSFGCKAEVQAPATSTNVTVNATTGMEETNATCHGYVVNNASNDTTCYFELDKESNSFSSPEKNVSAGIVAQGSEFSEDITGLENGTLYYCRVNANNSEGWTLSGNTVHFMTKPQPATSMQLVNISGGFNISWTHGDGYNISFLVFNTNHFPASRTDGTNIYADSNSYYRHTNLIPATTYYYRVWERAEWADPVEIQYSDGNESSNKSYAGTQPVLSNPNPANESINVSTSLSSWNITIESPMGATFNWTIQTSPNIGSSNANNANNGSKVVTLSGLNPSVTYTVFVNASETTNSQWSNETYWFTTESTIFVAYTTSSFGCKADVQGDEPALSNEQPSNTSINTDMYPLLQITVNEPQNQKFNISWSTNATGSWIYYNSSCSDGTFSQRATFANASNTKYWWTVRVNDTTNHWTNKTYHFTTATYTWSDWSDWWEFTYTCCVAFDFVANTNSKAQINLTWTNCTEDGCDKNVVVRNESGWANYPITATNGTEIYNGTLELFNDVGLSKATTYYYTIWGWNETGGEYSIINNTAYNTTFDEPTIDLISPINESIDVSKTPVCEIWANDTDGDTLTVTWQENSTGSYITRNVNTSVPADSIIRYTFTQFNSYSTTYYWKVFVNDGETNISSWFNFTTAANIPPYQHGENPVNSSVDQATTPTLNITVNDTNGDIMNASWYSNSSGSWLSFGSNDSINTGDEQVNIMQEGTNFSALDHTYYWSVNLTDGILWTNETYHFTTSGMEVSSPYPPNESTENTRPPVNISVQVNGTSIDVFFYWYNMTPMTDVWELVTNWTGQSTNRFNYTTLWSNGWVWGNTTYHWTVNVTDGTTWINNSYSYTTTELANGANARYDVSNDNWVDGTDLLNVYAHRTGETAYDGIYDVNTDDWVDGTDLLLIYANRS